MEPFKYVILALVSRFGTLLTFHLCTAPVWLPGTFVRPVGHSPCGACLASIWVLFGTLPGLVWHLFIHVSCHATSMSAFQSINIHFVQVAILALLFVGDVCLRSNQTYIHIFNLVVSFVRRIAVWSTLIQALLGPRQGGATFA